MVSERGTAGPSLRRATPKGQKEWPTASPRRGHTIASGMSSSNDQDGKKGGARRRATTSAGSNRRCCPASTDISRLLGPGGAGRAPGAAAAAVPEECRARSSRQFGDGEAPGRSLSRLDVVPSRAGRSDVTLRVPIRRSPISSDVTVITSLSPKFSEESHLLKEQGKIEGIKSPGLGGGDRRARNKRRRRRRFPAST
jgi:hypothetical protein